MRCFFKILFFFCVVFFAAESLNAQAVTWQRVYGGLYEDYGDAVIQTFEGGYIIAGQTRDANNDRNIYLIKIDYLGNIEWEKSIGDPNIRESANSIKQTSDSGYILTATRGGNFFNVLLLRLNNKGDTLWSKIYSYKNRDSYIRSLKITSDGGFIMCGDVFYINPPGRKAYIIRTDNEGNLLWQNVYSDSMFTNANDIVQTQSGNFYYTGRTYNNSGLKSYIILDKISNSGIFLNHKTFEITNGNSLNSGYNLILEGSDKIVISGQFDSAISNIKVNFLLKADTNGNQIWQKSYWPFAGLRSMAKCQNGDYIIGGSVGQPDYNLAVLRTDKNGNKIFQNLIPTLPDEVNFGISISMTDDNGAVFTGYTTINSPNKYTNVIAVKLDSLGNAPVNIINYNNIVPEKFILFQNYPNPFNPVTNINYEILNSGLIKIKVFDISGKEIANLVNKFQQPGRYSVTFNGSNFASGAYFYRLDIDNNSNDKGSNFEIKKMILIK